MLSEQRHTIFALGTDTQEVLVCASMWAKNIKPYTGSLEIGGGSSN
jgi:hypothetical protein